MDRRTLLALAPLVTLFASEALAENAEPAAPAAAPTAPALRPPLFADDAQFWFETQRAFGATPNIGGSLFGEVLAVALAHRSQVIMTAGTTPGMTSPIALRRMRPISCRASIASAHATVQVARNVILSVLRVFPPWQSG